MGVIKYLGDDHGPGRIEQLQHAKRTRIGQEQIDDQAGHNRRKPHERIQERSHCATPREAVHGQHSTNGKAEEGGDSHRGQRDLEGQRYDLDELRIERDDLPYGRSEGLGKVQHLGILGTWWKDTKHSLRLVPATREKKVLVRAYLPVGAKRGKHLMHTVKPLAGLVLHGSRQNGEE